MFIQTGFRWRLKKPAHPSAAAHHDLTGGEKHKTNLTAGTGFVCVNLRREKESPVRAVLFESDGQGSDAEALIYCPLFFLFICIYSPLLTELYKIPGQGPYHLVQSRVPSVWHRSWHLRGLSGCSLIEHVRKRWFPRLRSSSAPLQLLPLSLCPLQSVLLNPRPVPRAKALPCSQAFGHQMSSRAQKMDRPVKCPSNLEVSMKSVDGEPYRLLVFHS